MNMKPTDRNHTHTYIYIYWYILGILYWWKSKSISSDSRQCWRFLPVLSCSYCKLSWSCLGLCLRPIRQISLPDCELHEYGRRLESSTRSPLVNVLACSGFMRLPDWVCVFVCVCGGALSCNWFMLMGLPNICSTLANVMMMIISHVCHCCKTVIRVWPAVVDICKEKLNKARQVSGSGHTSRYPVDS